MSRASQSPLVSITTVTFNSAKTLARTIESVLSQGYGRIEYIIMDGCSSDGTVDIANSYAGRFASRGFSYRVVSEPDRGMYDAINKAMDLSTGEILGNINSDDWYEPDAVERVVESYRDSGGFDLLYADLRIWASGRPFIKRAKPMRPYETSRKWNHPTTFLGGRGLSYRYRLDNPYADFDLFLRLRGDGGKILLINEVLANFSFGGISTKKSWADVRKRIGWKTRVFRDNGCSPLSYLEGIAIEVAKYLKA